MVWKGAITIISIMIMFIMFPLILDSTHDVRTDEEVDTFAAISTGVGETTANVTLTRELWDEETTSVTTITSTLSETPTASSYNSTTQALTIAGLVSSNTRTFTVAYDYGALDDYTGMDSMAGMAPLLIFMGIFIAIIGGLYSGYKNFK